MNHLRRFSTFVRRGEKRRRRNAGSQTCCPLTTALYVCLISEILEDETASDYDTNATLKAKTLYKSCIDTGKNQSEVPIFWVGSLTLIESESFWDACRRFRIIKQQCDHIEFAFVSQVWTVLCYVYVDFNYCLDQPICRMKILSRM